MARSLPIAGRDDSGNLEIMPADYDAKFHGFLFSHLPTVGFKLSN